jgi:hypothetical protein
MGVWTYDAESADELLRGLDTSDNDHLDKVAADANHNNHGEGLEDADKEEHLAQGHGTIAGNRHVCG